MTSKVHSAFTLGLMVAEHIHGVNRNRNQALTDAILIVLKDVSNGCLALLDTPEEFAAKSPDPPPELASADPKVVSDLKERAVAVYREQLNDLIRIQREVATEVLREYRATKK